MSDDKAFERLQASLAQDAKAEAALIRVVVFFDGLGQCLVAELCDRDTCDCACFRIRLRNRYGIRGLLGHLQKVGSTFAHGVFIVNDFAGGNLGGHSYGGGGEARPARPRKRR